MANKGGRAAGRALLRGTDGVAPMVRSTRHARLKGFGWHVAAFIISAGLGGVLEAVILGLTLRDLGLLLAAFAVAIVFVFEMIYQHNVRVGRIPPQEAEVRAGALRIMMLPMVYLAADGLAFPFLDANEWLVAALGFPVLTFAALGWLFVRARRVRRARQASSLRTPLRPT